MLDVARPEILGGCLEILLVDALLVEIENNLLFGFLLRGINRPAPGAADISKAAKIVSIFNMTITPCFPRF